MSGTALIVDIRRSGSSLGEVLVDDLALLVDDCRFLSLMMPYGSGYESSSEVEAEDW
jgi:hypothetical protein